MAKFKLYHQRLRILRHFYGYSLQDLAEKTEVSKQALSQYENGDTLPKYPNLIAICSVLKVDVSTLTSKNVLFEIGDEVKIHKVGEQIPEKIEKNCSISVVSKSVCEHDWEQKEDHYTNYYHECKKCHKLR
jgi:transcriptional regulator with XRE-family HTH domain